MRQLACRLNPYKPNLKKLSQQLMLKFLVLLTDEYFLPEGARGAN